MGERSMIESGRYLTFKLDEELYALSISQVREVLDYTSITKVPQMPDFIRGVINLRGGVVPVVDLRLKFGMAEGERTMDTCIIITEITLGGEKTLLGIMADGVQEVVNLAPEQIEPPPAIGTRLNTSFIIILSTERVFSEEEFEAAASDAGGGAGENPPIP